MHCIHACRHDCIKGRPGPCKDYMLLVSEEEIREEEMEVRHPTDENIYQEYFEYVMMESEMSSRN